jgi:adenylate cyclase
MIRAAIRRLRRRLALTMFAICLPPALLVISLADIGGINSRTRDLSLDSYTQWRPFAGDPELARRMVFVDIDEASLARFGQWPWPRQYMAVLLQNIGFAEPLAIGVDILMSEPDRFHPDLIERLGDFPQGSLAGRLPDGDALLGEMLSFTPSVLAISLTDADDANPPYLPATVSVIGETRLSLLEESGLLSPVEKVARAPGAGFVSLAFERDSVIRRIPMVARYGEHLLPSITAEMLRVAQGAGGHILKQAVDTGTAVNQLRTGKVTMTLDSHGRLPLYHGMTDRFVTVPASQVLDETGLDRFTGALVIIGSSAAGLKDTHSTNLQAAIPGPMIHLSALHQILGGVSLRSSRLYEFGELVAAMMLAIIVGILAAHAPVGAGIAATGIATAGTGWAGFWLFTAQSLLSNAILTAAMVLASGLACLSLRGMVDEMARRQLRRAFGRYLSPQMVRTIEQSGTAPELGGETTDISVMFMDVRGFTTLSESMSSNPQALTRLINIILDEASEIILAHEGTLDKFIGDCVMAFWNAPLAQPDHHSRAVAAAIALQQHVPAINQRLRAEIGDAWRGDGIRIGVGVASGTVVVGNFGSRSRLSYSVVGDTVNLAARLEPFSKQTGLPLTFANTTAMGATATGATARGATATGAAQDLLKIDEITVRGRAAAEPIHSWLPLNEAARAAHDRFLAALLASRTRRGVTTLTSMLDELAAMPGYPDSMVSYYRNRIDSL